MSDFQIRLPSLLKVIKAAWDYQESKIEQLQHKRGGLTMKTETKYIHWSLSEYAACGYHFSIYHRIMEDDDKYTFVQEVELPILEGINSDDVKLAAINAEIAELELEKSKLLDSQTCCDIS